MNRKKQRKPALAKKFNPLRMHKGRALPLSLVWEFENYSKEWLKALGIIQ